MKFKPSELMLIILIAIALFSFHPSTTGSLVIKLNNIKVTDGIIWLALYDSEETLFVRDNSILKRVEVENTGAVTVSMDNVQFGTYALAIFHDIDSDGKLDQNILGIPTEPYAFARKPKSKWRAPQYDELTFDFSEPDQKIVTELKTWWEQ